MKTTIIYHDFKKTQESAPAAQPIALSEKNHQLVKIWKNIHSTVDATCVTLCGTCIAVSAVVLCYLLLG